MTYTTPTEVWQALSSVHPGDERAKILKIKKNRNLILNSGSFVVFSTGKIDEGAQSYKDKLSPIRILQSQRLAIATARFDGKGTFGGLSERTQPDENLMANITIAMSSIKGKTINSIAQSAFRKQLERLVALKDDLKLSATGEIEVVSDLSEIARTTAARETMEEALEIIAGTDICNKLHIDREGLRYIFQEAALIPVPLTSVKDDNYVINIWSGDLDNPAYAVTPFGHLIDLDEDAFYHIINLGKEAMVAGRSLLNNDLSRGKLIGREILGIEDIPLFDALKQWGKYQRNGERDLSHDYRYPHEWLAVWHKAQIELGANQGAGGGLGFREAVMISLIEEVQSSIIDDAEANGTQPYNVDLLGVLTQMNGGHLQDISQLEGFEEDFGLPHQAFYNMHKAAEKVMQERGYVLTVPVIKHTVLGAVKLTELSIR